MVRDECDDAPAGNGHDPNPVPPRNGLDFNHAPLQGQPRSTKVEATDIKPRLNEDVAGFLQWLYAGRALIKKDKAFIGNVYGEPGLSLSIELHGASAGLWYDFESDEGGDLIDLYCAWRGFTGKGNFDLSLREIAHDYLGDAVELKRPISKPTPIEKIATDKKKLGTKPAADVPLGAPIATYHYKNADGSFNTDVVRYEPKTFRPRHLKEVDGVMKWAPGMPSENRPLFHLPEIIAASQVIFVEGEGKANALADALNITVTTIMGGSNEKALEKTDLTPLAGKPVCIWPDNDAAGLKHADNVAAKLIGLGCWVWMVPIPPGAPPKWDCKNCIEEGGDPAAVLATAVEVKGPSPGSATEDVRILECPADQGQAGSGLDHR